MRQIILFIIPNPISIKMQQIKEPNKLIKSAKTLNRLIKPFFPPYSTSLSRLIPKNITCQDIIIRPIISDQL
jgi:hypothetical protein